MKNELLRYQPLISKIEVTRVNVSDPDDLALDWEVTIHRPHPNFGMAIGHLFTASANGVGQVLVNAPLFRGDTGDTEVPSIEDLQQYLIPSGCVEAMYDQARRALDAQAAMMDFSFDIPVKSPRIEVEIFEDFDSEEASEIS